MKSIILLFLTLNAFAQFTNETTKKIDKIQNNTASDITIDPSNDLIISSGTANRVPYFDPSKKLLSSSVTDTELGYLSGVTSGLQSQIDGKEPTINLTPNRAVTSDGAGSLSVSATTDTELGFLSGVTSNVQTQINAKLTSPLTTDGDLMIYNTTEQRLPIGSTNQILTVIGGFPSWQDAPVSTTLNTKGQLQGFSTVNANVGPCTDDQILVYDTLEATGWKCSDPPSTSPTTTEGDLILRGATEDERLPIGAVDYLLTSNGTTASWQPAPVSTTLTTKGDLQTFDTANARLPVGNDDEVLFADSTTSTGLAWKDPATVVFSVAQSEYVGSLEWRDNDCLFERANTGYGTMISSTSGCSAIIDGNITYPITNQSAFTIPNAPVGRYKIDFQGFMYNQNNTNVCKFTLSRDGDYDDQGEVYVNEASGGNRVYNTLTGHFKNSTAGDLTIRIVNKNTGGTTCRLFGNANNSAKFAVYYYPPQSQIVRQGTENFAKSLGTLTFPSNTNCDWSNPKSTIAWTSFSADSDCIVATASTGSVIQATANKIPQFVLPSGSKKGLYKIRTNGIFMNNWVTDNKACWYRFSDGTINSTANSEYVEGNDSFDGSKTFEFILDEATTTDKTFTLQSSPVGVSGSGNCILRNLYTTVQNTVITVEYVPTDQKMTITGSFEQIKSGDTPIVRAQGNANQAIGGTTDLPFVELVDNFNAWDGDSFTVPSGQGGYYFFSGSVFLSGTGSTAGIYIAVNNVREQIFGFTGNSVTIHPFSGVIQANEGDVLSLRASAGSGLSNNSDFHHLHIQKIPDIESLVKNLNDNKSVKVHTKILSANGGIGTNVDLADLQFDNLTIGRKYRLSGQVCLTTRSGNDTRLLFNSASSNSGTKYGRILIRDQATPASINCVGVNFTFTAVSTSVYSNSYSISPDYVQGDGTRTQTFLQLEELPDYYIETSEF